MKITLIAGARPNFMKIAPLIRAINQHNQQSQSQIEYRLVHTGQHYDDQMSNVFFRDLGLPDPDANLGSGSGTQAEQTAKIMIEFERDLVKYPTDLVVVVGDVTSTLACTIVAKKMQTKVAHVEGGIRSFDMTMPEEINRLVTDALADYFFTTSDIANENLQRAGIPSNRIHFVGNTMIDSLTFSLNKLRKPALWADIAGLDDGYYVLTLHRPSNVDDITKLRTLLMAIDRLAAGRPVIFPVHPRTRKNVESFQHELRNISIVSPLGYFEFVYLIRGAMGVVTDSGGVQEETTVLNVPCITLRANTERPETVSIGTNVLIGDDLTKLENLLADIAAGKWKKGAVPPLWDGNASERIVRVLASLA